MKSKIILLSIAAGLMLSTNVDLNAQSAKSFYGTPYTERNSGSFGKGTSILSIGYGFGNIDNLVYNNLWTGVKRRMLGPVYGKFEVGIMDEVGVGVYAGVSRSTLRYTNNSHANRNTMDLGIGLVGYYHFNKFIPVEKLDVFAGIGFGLKMRSNSYPEQNNTTTVEKNKIWASPAIKIGARYYFSDNFGVYVESGYDRLSSANIGISLRF